MCLSRLLCKVSYPSSDSNLSMLHSLVAPVIVLAASIWIASSFFFISDDELSQTESQYSNSGRMKETYICSRDFRLILNLRALINFNLTEAFSHMFSIWSVQRQVLEKVTPKCLWLWVSLISLLFMKSGGWMGLLTFLDTTIDKVFAALKSTSQKFAQETYHHWGL